MAKARRRTRGQARRIGSLLALFAAPLTAALVWFGLPDPADYLRAEPKTTALIEQRKQEAKERSRPYQVRRTVVRLGEVAPVLAQAVLLSEDARFWAHEGFDWKELKDAAERDLESGSFERGGSTITQQLAKNLYLGTKKSLWRKAKEAILTVKMERALDKERILELYLSVVELGPGVFGVEAGAQHHFQVSAARVRPHQAALLAAMLPAPRKADVHHPTPKLASRARRILRLLAASHTLSAAEYSEESRALEELLGPP
ncbi:MAG: monofunctional biosynthetic peptidoglycan transglycosylase [Myxococcota bacterium]